MAHHRRRPRARSAGRASARSKPASWPTSSSSACRRARQTPLFDPVSQVVYASRGDDVETTIVNGKVLMRDRKVLTMDEAAVLREARAAADLVRKAVQ